MAVSVFPMAVAAAGDLAAGTGLSGASEGRLAQLATFTPEQPGHDPLGMVVVLDQPAVSKLPDLRPEPLDRPAVVRDGEDHSRADCPSMLS